MSADNGTKILFLLPQLYAVHIEPLARLNELRPIEVAVFGSRMYHAGGEASTERLPFPLKRIRERDARAFSRRPDIGAVVIDARGRVAFGATVFDRKRVAPLVLWSTLWEFPSTIPWLIGRQLVKHGYRKADAVVTPGDHISQKARRYGAMDVWEAIPSVSAEYWTAQVEPEREYELEALFVGRAERGKGLDLLIPAWQASQAARSGRARLRIVGPGDEVSGIEDPTIEVLPPVDLDRLRRIYAGSDFMIAPSIRTRTFSEDWGHSRSEAMMTGTPVIASTRVGAAAAGCIRDGDTGLVFRAGDGSALTAAIDRMASDSDLRARLSVAGQAAVLENTPELWAQRMGEAIEFAIDAREANAESSLEPRYV